jgi:hypothetical protein
VYFSRPAQFTSIGHPNYDATLDVDGDGLANVVDLVLSRNFAGSTLPAGTPAGAPAAAAGAIVSPIRSLGLFASRRATHAGDVVDKQDENAAQRHGEEAPRAESRVAQAARRIARISQRAIDSAFAEEGRASNASLLASHRLQRM